MTQRPVDRSSCIAAGWAGRGRRRRARSGSRVPAPAPLAALAVGAGRAVAVLAVLAGVVGDARAMFLSEPRPEVVLLVVRGRRGVARRRRPGRRAVARWSRALRVAARRFGESGAFAARRAGPAELPSSRPSWPDRERLAESREREQRAGGVPARAGRLGLARPAHPAGRAAGDGRGAGGRVVDDPASATTARSGPRSTGWTRLVDDLFELSRIHAGVAALTLQPVVARRPGLRRDRRRRPGRAGRRRAARRRGRRGLLVEADPAS